MPRAKKPTRRALIPRTYLENFKTAVRGEGIYLYDQEGKKYIDGCSGALLSSIGHGNREIADAVYKQMTTLEFAHSSRWKTEASEEAARELTSLAPGDLNHAWFGSGGSEAVECAMKLARNYFIERDGPGTAKSVFIARWNSYHGSTLSTMALGGNMIRRRPYSPLFKECPKIETPYIYRSEIRDRSEHEQAVYYSQLLEREIRRIGSQYVAAFIAEPVVGSSISASVPPEGYWQMLREICSRYDVLLIADEIMSGMGRTGKPFCVQHWDVVPDIMTSAKALSGGYSPVGAAIASDKIIDTILAGSGVFGHGHTYNANPSTAAAVVATIRYMKKNNVFDNCAARGKELNEYLNKMLDIPIVGDVRGKGLIWGIELVQNKESQDPFDPARKAAALVTAECFERGLIVYPSTGQIDGLAGDQFLLAPPLIVTPKQVTDIAERLRDGLEAASKKLLGGV
ncbi:MAG: aspartate aminotransferase family protein [Dethiosulfovibrio peptidovorans]|nr:MAG: aspartate aminotransferase family protein [Dethiosulfovibrio peptidovorans]